LEFLEEAGVLTTVKDVLKVQEPAAVDTFAVNFPAVGP
jgi:hypothetical protein